MKESSKKGKMLRLLPAMVVTVALVISQVSCIQKSANDEGQDAENKQNEITQNDILLQDAVSKVEEIVVEDEAVKKPESNYIQKDWEKDKKQFVMFTMLDEKAPTAFENLQTKVEFIGGINALAQYIRSNVNIPNEAKEAGVNIEAHISFLVEKDGKITNIECIKTEIEKNRKNPKVIEAAKLCEAEGECVIASTSGKWEPAVTKQGEAVSSKIIIPIMFAVH
jgi:protein TonB